MGTWTTKINGNDTFLDIYHNFFDLYNQGGDPNNISKQIQEDFTEMFNDYDDRNNCLFGLALAQWETKALDLKVFQQVKEIIDSGNDLEVWKGLGADNKTLQLRKAALDKFLLQLSIEKEKPKRRVRPKHEFTYKDLINITAPDGQKVFTVSEHFTNGAYVQTGSLLSWGQGGGSILYFEGQGKHISAKWRDSQTLEVTHHKDIVFTKKDETFFYCGDQGKVIYIPIDLYPAK
ncbi:MAG: hypothetical protein P4L51_15305 [Puia sp.]|nr:hypothetical protein [Puia sp.]